MSPLFSPEQDRPAPSDYLRALPDEPINPCELAELEMRAQKAEAKVAELEKDLQIALKVIAEYKRRK